MRLTLTYEAKVATAACAPAPTAPPPTAVATVTEPLIL